MRHCRKTTSDSTVTTESHAESLKIIHVFRAPVGGLFRHVIDLAQGQIARGHFVGMIVGSTPGDARSEDRLAALAPRLNLGLRRISMRRHFDPMDLLAIAHVTNRIRQVAADIIHGHGAKGGAYARLAAPGRSVLRTYTPHGGSLLLRSDSVTGRVYLALERVLAMRSSLCLFESAYSEQVFRTKIGKANGIVRVVHNGISTDESAPVPVESTATDLLFIGEFRAVKGIDILIDALARLHDRGRPITATIVGHGPEEVALKAQVRGYALTHAVRFMPPMAARNALRHGRIVVLPSRAESLPYVALEAAAAGRPLIATNVGGIPEIFGPLSHNLTEPEDPDVLAEAILWKIDNPGHASEIAAELRRRVILRFSIDEMTDKVCGCYQEANKTLRLR